MKLPIAFDFDGTITKYNEYPNCGVLRSGIQNCIQDLTNEGYPIIIHTCRSNNTELAAEAYADMVSYLRDNGICYTTINSNAQPSATFNPLKIYAAIYVDDSALGWNPNWDGTDIYRMIKDLINTHRINTINDTI